MIWFPSNLPGKAKIHELVASKLTRERDHSLLFELNSPGKVNVRFLRLRQMEMPLTLFESEAPPNQINDHMLIRFRLPSHQITNNANKNRILVLNS